MFKVNGCVAVSISRLYTQRLDYKDQEAFTRGRCDHFSNNEFDKQQRNFAGP